MLFEHNDLKDTKNKKSVEHIKLVHYTHSDTSYRLIFIFIDQSLSNSYSFSVSHIAWPSVTLINAGPALGVFFYCIWCNLEDSI